MRIVRLLIWAILCTYVFPAHAQLSNGTVDPGPYTPGSTIAATFSIDPAACIPQGNIFSMYLSDKDGNFNAPLTLIGQYNSFYSTFVNGTIPAGTPAGTGYKIRIQSSTTSFNTESNAFSIHVSSTPAIVNISSTRPFGAAHPNALGSCISLTGTAADITITRGTSTGDVTATLTNELNKTTSTLGPLTTSTNAVFRPLQAHYTMLTKVIMPDGTVGTRAYFIINNKTITTLNTSGSNTVCLDNNLGGTLTYPIDQNALLENFPGNTYQFTWGDLSSSTYTICDLQNGFVEHNYVRTSCGQTNTSGGVTTYNSFGVTLQMSSPFCGNVGTPISTTARVIAITENRLNGPDLGCTNTNITFTNSSILGDNPNNNSASCLQDDAIFNWYVDGNFIQSGTYADALVYRFTTNGVHVVELESISTTGCQGPRARHEICIQNAPAPSFTVASTTICAGDVVIPDNTSLVDEICDNTTTYTWLIARTTAPTNSGFTYVNGTNASFEVPQIRFTSTGTYTMRLMVTTATCGSVTTSAAQTITITVNEPPQAILSNDFEVCTLGTYNFNTANSPTRSTAGGTTTSLADTYTWTVTGAGGSIPTFINSTTSASQYPSIRFDNYDVYTVTLVHKNNCDIATDTQIITFSPGPTVDAGSYADICYNTTSIPIAGTITGNTANVTGYTWSSAGGGSFTNATTLNPTYTPSLAEKTARTINIRLTVTTSLTGTCSTVQSNTVINIKAPVTINSAATKAICTGDAVAYNPTSTTVGTTFTWTATGSANAGGFSDGSGATINDVLTNSSTTTNATVTYTITPTGDGCTGDAFTFTVTIQPIPVLTATPTNTNICTQQGSDITLSSNIVGTTYTWTTSATGGVTGHSANATPTTSTTINQTLLNNNTTAGTVTYTITPSNNGCPGTPVVVVITVEPAPSDAVPGANASICNVTTYTFAATAPAVGTGTWTVSDATVIFDDVNSPTATASNLVPGSFYSFTWTVTAAASCTAKSANILITVNALSEGGTTAANNATVCAGTNSETITLTGQVGSILGWQSSINSGITWTNISNTTSSLTFSNLTTTTQYRAIVQNGSCATAISTVTTITVNPPVPTSNAGVDQTLCGSTSATLAANNPAPNTGLWTVTSGSGTTFVDATSPTTIVNDLVPGRTYTFTWTITGVSPCPASNDDVVIYVDLPSVGGTTATTTPGVCSGSNTGVITLSGQTGTVQRWERSIDAGVTWTNIINTTTSLTFTNLTATTQYRALVKNGTVCAAAYSTITTITVNAQTAAANAGLDQTLCDLSAVTLSGNPATPHTGLWTLTSGQSGVSFDDASLANAKVSGLVGGQTYTFLWTITGASTCPPTFDEVRIFNLPELNNNTISTPNTTNCNGQTITVSGTLPTGGNGTYTYLWESSATGNAPWTTVTGQTGSNLTVVVTANISYRRIVNSNLCTSISNIITITALPSIANNSITGTQTICLTTSAAPILGTTPTGGDGTYVYGWEQSIDNGAIWTVVAGASDIDYAPGAITQTTRYRRLVSSAACTGSFQSVSNIITVTVNLNAKAEFTWTNDIGCVPFVINSSNIRAIAYPARNATYEWFADGVSIGSTITFPGYTINTFNTSVDIKLVTTSSLGCIVDEFSHTFRTRQDVIASYTQDETVGCGPLTVNFTNTTTTLTGVSFEWSIDGVFASAATSPTLVFQNNPNADKVYNVNLKVTTPCGITNSSSTVTVIAPPTASFFPDKVVGCSPLEVTFNNRSSSNSSKYTYQFDDGTPDYVTSSKAPFKLTFTSTDVKTITVTMTEENICGKLTSVPREIVISPNAIQASLTVNGTSLTGCAPFDVTFFNNTVGASKYEYDFGDGSTSTSPNTLPETITHRFLLPGTYTVKLKATNSCPSEDYSSVDIVVLPQPTATFTGDILTGCTGLTVNFASTTTSAISYLWDFGDGNSSTLASPTYTYNGTAPGQYTVSLTVINNLGCPFTFTRTNYITIVPPPVADFDVAPGAKISIPDYTFRFTNMSTNGAQTYKWDFGDKTESRLKDPVHTYPDTGKYMVTLIAYNQQGCEDIFQNEVEIIGVPGFTFVPNSFMPGGNNVPTQTFMAVGTGMKSWKMSVLNKWGQVLWETTKLLDGRPVEGWDGNYKGVPQPQGIYFWKIEVELINGTEWKGMSLGNSPPRRTGQIYLIR